MQKTPTAPQTLVKRKRVKLKPLFKKPNKDYTIKRVFIKNLFGLYNYEIRAPDTDNPSNHPQLMILYGDNGSGKTTILKLILHLLSPAPNRGHRTFIARTKFERFGVELENNVTVEAYRKPSVTEGSFWIHIVQDGNILVEVDFPVGDDGEIAGGPTPQKSLMLAHLAALSIDFHYLADDRRTETSDSVSTDDETSSYQVHYHVDDDSEVAGLARRLRFMKRHREPILEQAIENAVQWFRQHAITGADTGTVQANTIYADVIKRIADHGGNEVSATSSVDELATALTSLAKRNEAFSRFGLSPPFDVSDIQTAIANSKASNQRLIRNILQPYLDGITARLDALQELSDIAKTFVDGLNSFYRNKTVNLHLKSGLTIDSLPKNDRLHPQDLSSGEKQLLLLLCNVLSARDKASVFIIDEPEISLNVKWQRKLIAALLACMQGSNSQLILATHSMELLAQYRHNVIKLTSDQLDQNG